MNAPKPNANAIWTAIIAALLAPKLAGWGVHVPPEDAVAAVFVTFHAVEPYLKRWFDAQTAPPAQINVDALAAAIVKAIQTEANPIHPKE